MRSTFALDMPTTSFVPIRAPIALEVELNMSVGYLEGNFPVTILQIYGPGARVSGKRAIAFVADARSAVGGFHFSDRATTRRRAFA